MSCKKIRADLTTAERREAIAEGLKMLQERRTELMRNDSFHPLRVWEVRYGKYIGYARVSTSDQTGTEND